jgi:ADP-heptose:LPS heptosyltransferase
LPAPDGYDKIESMNPKIIYRLDRWVGTPACFILSLIERVARLFRPAPAAKRKPNRILFVKLVEMGSTVLACPAFEEAAQWVGRENIYILVFKQNRPIVDLLPYFPPGNILSVDDSSVGRAIFGLLRVLIRVRRERIDAAIDLEGLTRSSALITYLTGAPKRAGYFNFTMEGPYRGRLFTHEMAYNFQHHTSRMFVALLRALKGPTGQAPVYKGAVHDGDMRIPKFMPTDRDREEMRGLLSSWGSRVEGARVVILNPNCSDLIPLRRWPDERMIELGRRILAHLPDVILVLTGTESEKPGAEKIAAGIGSRERVLTLAGRTTLRQLLTLYGMAHVLVSNDSGPCHFASLSDIHVVALFGPETPQLYSPLGPRVRTLSAGLSCSPCVNMLNHRFSPCSDNRCMQAIPVDEVFDTVLKALDEPGETRNDLPHDVPGQPQGMKI